MTKFWQGPKTTVAAMVFIMGLSPFGGSGAAAQSVVDGVRYENRCLYYYASSNVGISDDDYIALVSSLCAEYNGVENPSAPLAPPITTVGSLDGKVCINCVSVGPSRIYWRTR